MSADSPSADVDTSKAKTPAEPAAEAVWLIRKRGYFYRPNRAGYTASAVEAGRYTEAEAQREAAEVEGCTAHRASEFPPEPQEHQNRSAGNGPSVGSSERVRTGATGIAGETEATGPRVAAGAAPPHETGGWQPIETAPKDGRSIIAWCVHQNARYAKDPIAEGWAAPVVARWIDHNGGGWTWHGHAGRFTHWTPLLGAPPTTRAVPCVFRTGCQHGQACIDAAQCQHGAEMLRRMMQDLCDDCPPVGYPTDKTRCLPCPRRSQKASETTSASPPNCATLNEPHDFVKTVCRKCGFNGATSYE